MSPRPGDGGPRLQPLTRGRVERLGEAGRAWVADLPRVLDDLAGRWGLELGRGLPGGSASYVVAVTTSDGEQRVLKVPTPDQSRERQVADVLARADGCGYVRLHAHDPATGALLLERLGEQLERTPLPPGEKIQLLSDTLLLAWTVGERERAGLGGDAASSGPEGAERAGLAGAAPMSGPEEAERAGLSRKTCPLGLAEPVNKAVSLAQQVQELDRRLGRPTDPAVLRAALDHAEMLAGWSGPTVVVHGDPHPANALRAPDGRGSGWVLVDPDGFRCDPAYDAGVVLRDWSTHLRGTDARRTLRAWTGLVADRTDLDPDRVWAWAFLERVSTGLFVTSLGAERLGRPFLESARGLL
ncbi:MAG: aminoglycoside phosphotransferase family protein [Nocardioides sp.]